MRESELFSSRAAACAADAEQATLSNVRERCLRAERAWTAMAQRSLRTESARDAREAAVATAAQAASDSDRPGLMFATIPAGG